MAVAAPRRRRLALSNLDHAFPERSPAWRRRIARVSARRLVETALLSVASPYLDERQIRAIAHFGPSAENWIERNRPGPTVFATAHLANWEAQTWVKLLSRVPLPGFGVIYRPLNNPGADAMVKRGRERFGMRLLSRREGFSEAINILRAGGCAAVLFDQNAGTGGALTTLFGRVCSTTELPGILAIRSGADVRVFYPRRIGFWRVEFESSLIASERTVGAITIALNRWLEGALAADDNLCSSWLWAHARWRNQDVPARRLRLEARRNLLAEEGRIRGLATLPRRTRIWVRMPNWLGDIVMTAPLLRALRVSRPDAEITLVAAGRYLPLLAGWNLADALHPLPGRGVGYFRHFAGLRRRYPDVWLLFTNSARGDMEAWLAGCPQRFGMVRPGRRRPLLTCSFNLPPDLDESRVHQIEVWERFLRAFGLDGPVDRSPIPMPAKGTLVQSEIGLVPGSENDPSKRWPAAHWRTLVAALPGERFVILGTAGDRPVAESVAAGFDPRRVENLAGRTDLPGYAERLRRCRLLVTNDTGGMHLANALGVPLVALFGPTNPMRTGPVFSAPFRILQPDGCAPTGGAPLAGLAPGTVVDAVRGYLRDCGDGAKPAS
jgi:ADP-heptose:LPS heptosyltransferase/lauroyl/myristoyl acyltransferase